MSDKIEFQALYDDIIEVAHRHGADIRISAEREELELTNSAAPVSLFTGNTLVSIKKGQKILEYRVRRVDSDSPYPRA